MTEGHPRVGYPGKLPIGLAWIAGGAFILYWSSAFILHERGAVVHFGADAHHYDMLAQGEIFERTLRYHPVTVGMALAWMKVLDPLSVWVPRHHLLNAMFAAIGAAGVWAAMAAFATIVPRRYLPFFGALYGCSLGVWYFSSIPESKIVSATLSAIYIASYLRLRVGWTTGRGWALTAILLIACLDEIVAVFLISIPIVDTLMRQGWNWRNYIWIAGHGSVGLFAFAILEVIVNGLLVTADADPERASLLSLLLFQITQNDYSLTALYAFAVNWLFFNIAAPTRDASYAVPGWGNFQGYFEPAFANYFSSPVSASLIVVVGVMVAASIVSLYRRKLPAEAQSILLALVAYTLIRGAFFFFFNPDEPMLFSPAVTLAYMLVIVVPFAASDFPAKWVLMATFAGLLFGTNLAFIIGP